MLTQWLPYHSAEPTRTSWCKIKNPDYTQAQGRHELFTARSGNTRRACHKLPLSLSI
jgi:hypothetical protein